MGKTRRQEVRKENMRIKMEIKEDSTQKGIFQEANVQKKKQLIFSIYRHTRLSSLNEVNMKGFHHIWVRIVFLQPLHHFLR